MFTIPSDGQGGMFLPNLSAFHSYIASRAPNSIAVGNNEITLAGQGVGRQLMRILWRTQNGTPPVPLLPVTVGSGTTPNILSPYWRYGPTPPPRRGSTGRTSL